MARVFEFRDNLLNLEVNGNEYKVDVFDKDWLEKYEPLQKQANNLAKEIREGKKKQGPKVVEEMMELLVETIDTFLGDGATKDIFGDRVIRLLDLMDMVTFLNEERADFQADRLRETSAYSPNRAERRK